MNADAASAELHLLIEPYNKKSGISNAWWIQLTEILTGAAKQVAQSVDARESFGCQKLLWSDLTAFWEAASTAVYQDDQTVHVRQACLYLARFTRNLVAGVNQNQKNALVFEPTIRGIIKKTTSFFMMQNSEWNLVTTTLIQTLSNIATNNEETRCALWPQYMDLKEEENILLRSLASPDPRAVIATTVLILNCVQNKPQNTLLLVTRPSGIALCRAMLDRANNQVEQCEGDDCDDGTFSVIFHIFQNIFETRTFPPLWHSLTNSEEPITPHQTILLKLVDSYLQSGLSTTEATGIDLIPLLVKIHLSLSDTARAALGGVDGSRLSTESRLAVDPRLPGLTKALVLISQCLISLILSEQTTNHNLAVVKAARSQNEMTVADECIDLLHRLDILLPRIVLGRAQYASSFNPLMGTAPLEDTTPVGFEYIKRDLVRLLGILCHKDRATQDSIREDGGIPLIMNMCVIDERNPYLREHALFTLRNLLQDNPENKKLVDEIKPLNRWEAEGRLF